MAQLINFDNYTPTNSDRKEKALSPSIANSSVYSTESEADNSYQLTLNVLVKSYPNKIIFTIKEAAEVLGVGAEFIRRRIKSGRIKATYLGDKPFINIAELARISTEGV